MYLTAVGRKQRKPALNFPGGLKFTFTSVGAAVWQAHKESFHMSSRQCKRKQGLQDNITGNTSQPTNRSLLLSRCSFHDETFSQHPTDIHRIPQITKKKPTAINGCIVLLYTSSQEASILQSSSPRLKFSDYHPTHVDLKTTQNRHGGKPTKLYNAFLENLTTKL